MTRIAILTDEPGWHGRRLRRAFVERGAEVRYVKFGDCRIDLQAGPHGLVIGGFGATLPDAVFVRSIPAGSFEQVTLRLTILHAMHERGVVVYNTAASIERSVDKARTSLRLHQAGLPTPATWVSESEAITRRCATREHARGRGLVAKPLFGSQGKGLRRIDAADPGSADACAGVWYLQRFVPPKADGYRDWRVMVIGGRAIAAMERRAAGWITNVAQGASVAAADLPDDALQLAVAAAAAVDLAYAGVDLIRDGERWSVLEVNGIPSWEGLQRVAPVDVAAALADDLLGRCVGRPSGQTRAA